MKRFPDSSGKSIWVEYLKDEHSEKQFVAEVINSTEFNLVHQNFNSYKLLNMLKKLYNVNIETENSSIIETLDKFYQELENGQRGWIFYMVSLQINYCMELCSVNYERNLFSRIEVWFDIFW